MTKKLVLFSILCLHLLLGCNQNEILIQNLSEHDANEIMVALKSHHISAHKKSIPARKNISYSINVRKKDLDEALKILVINQLPKASSAGLKEVYPPGSSGIIPSQSDEKARLTMAMQGEIESLIKILPGVMDAKVVLSIGQMDNVAHQAPKKCSVAIIINPKHSLESLINEKDVQTLVSSSIAELKPEDVAVVIKQAGHLSYLGSSKNTDSSKTVEKKASSNSDYSWLMLSISLLALMLSAYGMLRMKWSSKVSLPK